ncbi:YfhO family protein [Candidatus Desantisbacteria bacterium]|nr:YfhO family protein [Candidatus Desantisbacteria bacterium]
MKKILPIGLLISLVLLFFGKITCMSEAFLRGDLLIYFYPMKLFYAENLKEFNLPLWLPHNQCGFPLLAVGNLGFFYPINLLLFFSLPTLIAINLTFIIHYILAGVFTYFYAKVIGLSRFSAIISGLIFMFSGFLLAHLQHIDILTTAIWLPLILIFMEKILSEGNKTPVYVILAGISIGIQILAGHQQITLYSLSCISLYFFFGVLYRHPHKIPTFLGTFMLIMLIGFGIGAIQMIPTYELLSLSDRGGGISLKYANSFNFLPMNFITFVLPYFLGDLTTYYGKWNFEEGYAYVGIFTLILLLFGIFKKPGNRYIYFFSTVLILSAILMLGSITPLYTALWHLPVFNAMRAPARFAYLLTFSTAIIAGFGASCLINLNYNKKVVFNILSVSLVLILICGGTVSLIGIEGLLPQGFFLDRVKSIKQDVHILFAFLCISIILLMLWTKQKLGLASFKFLVLTLIIIDLFLFGLRALPPTVKMAKLPSIFMPQTAKFLLQDTDIYRTMSVYPGVVAIRSRDKNPNDTLIKLLTPNFNAWVNISNISTQLGLFCVQQWKETIELFRAGTPLSIKEDEVVPFIIKNSQLLNLFNVKYILFTLDINDDRFPTVFEDNGVKIIENKEVLPRAFVVHNVKVIKGKEKVLKALSSKEFNPRQYVILEQNPQVNVNSNSTASSTAKIINYGNKEVVIHCNMKDNGFLILTDTYYPGWQIYIDNKKGKIYRAYHTFRAVYLEKGNHLLRFKYEPLSFKAGMCISLLTLCCVVVVGCRFRML